MAEQYLIKNSINPKVVEELARSIKKNDPSFKHQDFSKEISKGLSKLELNQRLDLVTDMLFEYLPKKNFPKAADILLKSLPPELPNSSKETEGNGMNTIGGLNGFIMVSLGNYISRYGLNDFEVSMKALYELTKRFSAENSIRYFLINDQKKTLKVLKKWCKDKNMHVRRLASEGVRPRLPWTIQLKDFVHNPKPVLPILELLKQDKELYVRRSVANCLNDISKDHPEIAIETLEKWNKVQTPEMKWLIKHATRTLIKSGHPKALELQGVSTKTNVKVKSFKLSTSNLKFGNEIELCLDLSSSSSHPEKLIIDYRVHHVKANGKLAPKVFKWTSKSIVKGSPLSLSKRHAFKKITTRKYYSGTHKIELLINGKSHGMREFFLKL